MPERAALYQRRRRDRLRARGLIKREIWVPPEYADLVRLFESALQHHNPPRIDTFPQTPGRHAEPATRSDLAMSDAKRWSVETLQAAFAASSQAREGEFAVDMVEGAEPVMHLTMHDFGDLPVTVSVAGSQIVMSVLLWPVASIADQPAFERELLLTHKMIPLSTYGITTTAEGELWYEIFGALSSESSFETVLIELETLADNAIDATEHFESHVHRVA
ncbi:hypothetical protein SAMN07250955_10221 [Arboricoccus pini]|uniref:Sensory transduction regulator n=1 Tax=Arboricoccus pini TaxID=1963835 RepID=A0A212QMT2_9PROT|nr:YjfI family protein [Arboricoccus pini]SNB60679.1 hypothetical protein SAMN07250955_10221 [Arboricoccus pini]